MIGTAQASFALVQQLGKKVSVVKMWRPWAQRLRDTVTLLAGDPVTVQQTNLMRLAAMHAAHSCAQIAQAAYRVAEMSAIHKTHRLQQIVRDTMVVTQHASLSEANYEEAGALLLTGTCKPGYP